jgi:hypothetical protein
MNTHDADRQMPASAKTAAAPYPKSDQTEAFVNALVQGDRNGARDIFDAALVREQYPRLPILVGGQGLRWTDAAAWSDLDDVLCIASLDVLEPISGSSTGLAWVRVPSSAPHRSLPRIKARLNHDGG